MQRRHALEALAFGTAISGAAFAQSERRDTTSPRNTSPSQADAPFIVARDGTRLFWREWGRGRPILFLSSLALPSNMWDYQLMAFASHGFRCIAFDRRGHGRSDIPPGGYDYDTLADDVSVIIEALDLRDLTLVSHSMAGGEIIRYLSRHGSSRVGRIVLLATTTPFLLKTDENPNGVAKEALDSLWAGWRKDYPQWVAENVDPFFVPETPRAIKAWMVNLVTQITVPVAVACSQALAFADFRDEMESIVTPALVIHGDRDASAPLALTGKPSAALIPHCRLKIYEGAPHGLMYTHADRLHADMLRFISDTTAVPNS